MANKTLYCVSVLPVKALTEEERVSTAYQCLVHALLERGHDKLPAIKKPLISVKMFPRSLNTAASSTLTHFSF